MSGCGHLPSGHAGLCQCEFLLVSLSVLFPLSTSSLSLSHFLPLFLINLLLPIFLNDFMLLVQLYPEDFVNKKIVMPDSVSRII